MRLIDADALNVPHFHLATDKIKVLDMIDEAPTIDIDRPQGEWIEHPQYGTIQCDQCTVVYNRALYPKNYCPYCGARMFAKDINVPNKKGAEDD